MTVPPTKEGQLHPVPVLKEVRQVSLEGQIFSNSHSGKSDSSWTGRKHTGAAESYWETTQEENGKTGFPETKCLGDLCARSDWLTGFTCRRSKMQGG